MTATLDSLKGALPDWARDTKLNLGVVDGAAALGPRLAWGTALAAAASTRVPEVLEAVAAAAEPHLGDADRRAALAAASVMAMNNVYYRFRHFMGEASGYPQLPARLRMQAIGNPGVDHRDFELWCLAVSAIGGCEACVRSHEQVVRDKGGSQEQVHDAVRIAAVVNALATSVVAARVVPAPTT
ncbi:MAG: carboxymuconolactone decarboxylase family protein [Kofleriaceae bacterium]